ncbi:Ig-like domain-containing protein [Lignipirellula cremea]|uniref:SbsA Ig-like domain-containing protein n=1 Tax=Lignipirellula cremea TaxID=2528010 RepID=A0A518E3N3_9BACT|nr:Ig-like domain-containing protein [Lignipirellula cremea]QDU98682.1 hypothetical protein Pla8534_65550 [Lignipirellula cremea]
MPICLLLLLLAAPPELAVLAQDDPAQVIVQGRLPASTRLDGQPLAKGPVTAEQGEGLLTLSVLDEQSRPGPPMFGAYAWSPGRLTFTPRRPLTPGMRYVARLSLPGESPVEVQYAVPRPPDRPPQVVAIYPSGDKLPANLLKFYLEFSESMREGREIFDQIHLIDARGQQVEDPWRRKELWTPDGKRLTLWIHPGRVKRGVNLREEIGPALEPGQRYTLQIDAGLASAAGSDLAQPYHKTFTAIEPDYDRPLPIQWRLHPGAAGGREPLTIEFGEPLDWSLAGRLITVQSPTGQPLAGRSELLPQETGWRFTPSEPWQAARHTLAVDGLLEDLAGNTPLRAFETDLSLPALALPQLEREFQPEP